MTTPNAQTSVDVAGMTAAQSNFQSALDQVNTAYTDMTEQQSTLAANWTGETSSTFGQALASWLEDMSVVQSNLSTILEALSSNTGVYANTNEQSTQMANSFKTGMSGVQGLGF
jgi:WXG100 family type VII secretion target